MQFIITAYDSTDPDGLARRLEVRPRHLANMQKVKGTGSVVCAGGIMNEEGKPRGSFLIMEFRDRESLDDYLAHEPYVTEHVWQDIRVEPCNVVIKDDEMVK